MGLSLYLPVRLSWRVSVRPSGPHVSTRTQLFGRSDLDGFAPYTKPSIIDLSNVSPAPWRARLRAISEGLKAAFPIRMADSSLPQRSQIRSGLARPPLVFGAVAKGGKLNAGSSSGA